MALDDEKKIAWEAFLNNQREAHRAHDSHREFSLEMFRSVIAFGLEAIRTSVFVNGAALVANGQGKVEQLNNIVRRGWQPAQVAAGVTIDTGGRDKEGKLIQAAKYGGLHALRHFYASWCINRREDGGLGLPPKVVQERLGHGSIQMTMDVYGHLFPRGDDASEMAAAEAALLN